MNRTVRAWLVSCCVLVALMVVVGGVTRLTRSGLSIVAWDPLVGALPPLSHNAWQRALDAYRASPEGRLLRPDIDLAAFRSIYLVEWGHRLLARVVGLVLVVPFAALIARRALPRWLTHRVALAIILVALQAVVGWLMVHSGLIDVPRVSPYRLVAHLMMAFVIFGLLLDATLRAHGAARVAVTPRVAFAARVVVALALLTAASGGAMAGTHAGLLFATFPDMNGAFVPEGVLAGPRAVFEDPLTVHFDHRALALSLAVAALLLARHLPHGRLLVGAVAVQVSLGAATVMLHVPIVVAALHQLGGLLLFAATLYAARSCVPHDDRQRKPLRGGDAITAVERAEIDPAVRSHCA